MAAIKLYIFRPIFSGSWPSLARRLNSSRQKPRDHLQTCLLILIEKPRDTLHLPWIIWDRFTSFNLRACVCFALYTPSYFSLWHYYLEVNLYIWIWSELTHLIFGSWKKNAWHVYAHHSPCITQKSRSWPTEPDHILTHMQPMLMHIYQSRYSLKDRFRLFKVQVRHLKVLTFLESPHSQNTLIHKQAATVVHYIDPDGRYPDICLDIYY